MRDLVEVLESYMIAEEGIISKFKNWADKENDKISMKKHGMKYNEYLASQRPKTKSTSNEEKERNFRNDPTYMKVNVHSVIEEFHINQDPYPDGKFANVNAILQQLCKDIKEVMGYIFKSKEFKEISSKLCRGFNSMLSDPEALRDKYGLTLDDMDEGVNKLTPQYIMKLHKPKIGETYVIVMPDASQDECLRLGVFWEISEILEPRYENYGGLSTGDGDEGCIYLERY